jgi:arylsulfatase
MKASLRLCLASVAGLALAGCLSPEVPERRRDRPNILLVVADDLAYSDLGSYGGEIRTPHLDTLAESGLRATDFYVAPRGAPTRAMLLTGVDNHVAGFGNLRRRLTPDQEGRPGYEGRLNERVVTVASLLRDAGYRTYVAGNWELGDDAGSLPMARGFEQSFVLHDGAASHWGDMTSAIPDSGRAHYTRNGKDVAELPDDHFSSRAFTDFIISSVGTGGQDERPFFAYLSFQAPHGPLAVPDDWSARCAGRYDEGYDAIRSARLLRMKSRGLVAEGVHPYPGIPTIPAWKELSEGQQREQARKMELYAAMVENLDFHVGRLLDHLREIGEYHDTLIVFLSDNGAEPGDRGPAGMDPRNREWYTQQFPESDLESWGRAGSFVEYGPAWAQVGMVPFRLFKGTQAEGGIRSPLIVSGPGVARSGPGVARRRPIVHVPLHVMDLTPTFLDLANVSHPATYQDRSVAPLQGKSLLPLFAGEWGARHGPHEWLGFEFAGDRALRRGAWKLVWMSPPFGVGTWRLYRLDRDPAEIYDLSEKDPEQKQELLALWQEYAKTNGVVLPEVESEVESAAIGPPRAPGAQKSSPSAR